LPYWISSFSKKILPEAYKPFRSIGIIVYYLKKKSKYNYPLYNFYITFTLFLLKKPDAYTELPAQIN